MSMKEVSASTYGSQGTPLAIRGPCEPIILLSRYFESPTEVQLNSW